MLFLAAKLEKIVSLHHNFFAMDEKFTPEEQKAIASMLYHLAKADFRTRQAERECIDACLKELEFDATDFVPIPKKELPQLTYETLRKMSMEKKRIFSRMMTQLSRSDTHFGPRERKFVKEILEMCEIPFVHK